MNRWVIGALVVAGSCCMCSGGAVALGLLADEDGPAEPGSIGGARATAAGCPDTLDGWRQSITPVGLVLTRGDITAELPWTFEITDALRQGDSELNMWQAILGARYEPGQLARGQYGERRLAGPATERSSGRTVYIAFTSGAQSGYANAVAVIGPDESVLRAFPTEGSLGALAELNRFSLACAEITGRWKSGFHSIAERYAAGTGQYLGLQSAAAWRDMTLERGSYRRESSALLNGVFHKNVDSGSWSHDD
ncbi:MAG: hypothetical protein AB1938_23035 [Myxococcota bacterium]